MSGVCVCARACLCLQNAADVLTQKLPKCPTHLQAGIKGFFSPSESRMYCDAVNCWVTTGSNSMLCLCLTLDNKYHTRNRMEKSNLMVDLRMMKQWYKE